jgi:hypothetical protein
MNTVRKEDVFCALTKVVPYFPVDNACIICTSKVQNFVKNEYAQYTVEYFPVDNAHVIYTKGLNS